MDSKTRNSLLYAAGLILATWFFLCLWMYVQVWYSNIPVEIVAAQRFFEITSMHYWVSVPLVLLWISICIAGLAMKKIKPVFFLTGIILPPALSYFLAQILIVILVHYSVHN